MPPLSLLIFPLLLYSHSASALYDLYDQLQVGFALDCRAASLIRPSLAVSRPQAIVILCTYGARVIAGMLLLLQLVMQTASHL